MRNARQQHLHYKIKVNAVAVPRGVHHLDNTLRKVYNYVYILLYWGEL